MSPYAYVWEFLVAPGREDEFLALYGTTGAWVRLFESAPGFRGTLLLRDQAHPRRFLTIDWWDTEEAFRAFRAARAAEFEALDREGAGLTTSEQELGRFTEC